MSRRTAESSKAIRIAWQQEQERVKEGKGTRDWTPEQQQDIIIKGKAYDINGKAYEGQHMKSAEKYPEYQGDPNNIQFLDRNEHFDAHLGDWKTPTNWYYDPVTKQFTDFGEEQYIPCTAIDLSNPITISFSNDEILAQNKDLSNNKAENNELSNVSDNEILAQNKDLSHNKAENNELSNVSDNGILTQNNEPNSSYVNNRSQSNDYGIE